MDNLVEDFRNLKISALIKACKLTPYIHSVTLGPNCDIQKATTASQDQSVEEKIADVVVKPTSSMAGNTSPAKKLLIQHEIQRRENVQKAIELRQEKLLNFQKAQENNQKLWSYTLQQKLLNKMLNEETQIQQALEEHDKDVSLQYQKHCEYYQELAEKRKKKNEEIQAKERRKRELYAIVERIKLDQVEFRTVYQDIINTLKTKVINDEIRAAVMDVSRELKTLPTLMEEVITKCKMGKMTAIEAERSSELLQALVTIKNKILEVIEEYNKNQELKKEAERLQAAAAEVVEVIETVPDPNRMKCVEIDPININNYVSKDSLKMYTELQKFLEAHEENCKDLERNESLKQFRFDCKKAVNIPVNAISAVNMQHLLDKYNKLFNLLCGKAVGVGDSQVCAGNHPQGIAFCMNVLAKKFVLQGDLMISSNLDAAFCYATVILSLWNDFPNFGKLLLANFHKQCPYVVPFYIPKSLEQTDEEYYQSLGYQYNEGVIEKQDKFLKRMTGIMRLYSAILIGKPKRSQSQVNPQGLAQAWRWLSAVLNLKPRADITATMLHVFLETAGYKMQAAYGKEFKRIMNYIAEVFLPMMKQIDSGGPMSRLEDLLLEYKMKGKFEKPSGILPDHFW